MHNDLLRDVYKIIMYTVEADLMLYVHGTIWYVQCLQYAYIHVQYSPGLRCHSERRPQRGWRYDRSGSGVQCGGRHLWRCYIYYSDNNSSKKLILIIP